MLSEVANLCIKDTRMRLLYRVHLNEVIYCKSEYLTGEVGVVGKFHNACTISFK